MNWIQINKIEDLDTIIESSFNSPVAIFKHSTRCGISSYVLKNIERSLKDEDLRADLYFLDLIAFRDISNSIAERLAVVHQSPQLILIKDGKVLYHASHQSIDSSVLINN